MKILRYFILFYLLFHSKLFFAQDFCILAGDSSLSHYTNLIPDLILSDCCYNPPDSLCLDLNQDSHIDFYIVSWYRNFSMGSYGWTYIQAADNNKILVNSINNSIPDTLSNTDTVCSSGVWRNKGLFIDYASYWGAPGSSYSHTEWNYLLNKNVGLKLISGVDSTFGWVQVYAQFTGGGNAAVVKNFGCGAIPDYVAPKPPISSDVIVYPNPTYDIVNINLPGYTSFEIKLYNEIGETVYQRTGNQPIVDLSGLSSGLYVLKIITSDRTFYEKILKRKKLN
jgi:hypothetical protein